MCASRGETAHSEADENTSCNSEAIEAAKAEKARIKKLKKEEGRRRAIEMSKQRRRQQNQNEMGIDGNSSAPDLAKSTRHGARNQHRHKFFARWLLETFPFLQSSPCESTNGREKCHVLDIAGGKGELTARLSMCHNLRVVLVDPRRADVASCFSSQVLPKLPNKWQSRIEEQLAENQHFVQEKIDQRVTQLVMNFDDYTLESSAELQAAVQSASVLIGMHADGATEAIVDAALKYRKPFVVVPCCVFPRLFNQRFLVKDDGTKVPVRSHEQFCEYLLQKDTRFKREVLPFEGRNVGILWDGKDCDSD